MSNGHNANPSTAGELSEDRFVESISELTVQNTSQNVEVKDSYLFVGENYYADFLNRKLRNDAELTIEIQSTSTAICLLRREAASKHAHKGSCSAPGVLDLKITFINPGKVTAVEQRKFFVIPRISTPPENQVPTNPPLVVPDGPDIASAAFLNSLEFAVSNTDSQDLFEQKIYTLSYIEYFFNSTSSYSASTYKITKDSKSSANCMLGDKRSFYPKAYYTFI